jgi:plastocyanin
MRTSPALAAAAFLAVAAAQPAAAANQTVKATSGFAFVAKQVAVKPGETVTFINTGGVHNVKFDDGAFTQPADPAPAPWTTPARTFVAPGTFRYHCALHGGPGGNGMSGTVFVNATGTVPDIVAPRLSRVSARSGAGKVTLRITSSEAATVTVTLTRRNARKAYVAFGAVRVLARKGLTQAVVTRTAAGRRLTTGRYRARLVATDRARNRSAAVTISFPVN